MLACARGSPMLCTAHNSLKTNGADGEERRITNRCLCPQHSVSLGTQLLCSVKGTESLFDVEVGRLSVKQSQDQLESVLSCETQIRPHWGVERAREESGPIGVWLNLPKRTKHTQQYPCHSLESASPDWLWLPGTNRVFSSKGQNVGASQSAYFITSNEWRKGSYMQEATWL